MKGDTDAEEDETVIATLSLDGSNPGVTLDTSVVTHTILDDDTPAPEVSVAPDWVLIPSGVSVGGKFRLLFVTSTTHQATATDIATYNTIVQTRAKAGHSAITDDMGDQFTVVGSTSSVDARNNTSTTVTGEAIYWLGSDNRVANNYADFYDGNWDNYTNTNESGTGSGTVTVWTGSNDDGTKHSSNPLGANRVMTGALLILRQDPFTYQDYGNTSTYRLYGLSPVFTVAAATAVPEVSVRLMTGEGENRNADGEVEKPESDATVSFPLSLDTAPAADMTVCVQVAESGDTDRVMSTNEGIKTVSFMAGVQTGSIDVAWTDTAADDLDSVITVTAIPSSTAGCSSSDEYTVSSTQGADEVRITDDETTTVSLASSDMEMGEGDVANTAVMTVSLGRGLISGESVVALITLAAATTGARLPGHATPDFAVTATGTGVVLSNQTTATPRLTFTGSDSNTVQTATVTLTPVANLDDGDMIDETITATLSLIAGTGSGTVVTGGGVELVQASSMVTLSIDDDDSVPPPPSECSAQNTIFSETNLGRILENGGMATYCVRLTTAPSGGDTTVTLGRDGGNRFAANFSPASLTFTSSDYMTPQQVTVTGADEPNMHRNRPDMRLTHTANGGGYSSTNLGNVRVEVDDAPEVEAWDTAVWTGANRSPSQRPSTITTSNGFSHFRQDFAPGRSGLYYKLRLSNRPETGGTVTVTATSSDFTRFGLALTPGGTPKQSLTVTFEDRGADPGCHNSGRDDIFVNEDGTLTPANGRVGDDRDNTPDTAWRCYRRIWVINRQNLPAPSKGCSTINHTASGGGLRATYVGSIRAHTISNNGRSCPRITGTDEAGDDKNYNPQASPAQAASVPTEKISNLQVTALDATSVSVTWDAVEHATSYDVSWSTESSDSLNASAGAESVTGTSATIQHDAMVPMTLTVTVTPEYIDKNGVTKQLDALASEATLEVGPGVQELGSGGGTNGGDGGSIDAGFGAVDLPVPVSHWRFEDDAVDWVGSSHGTEKGGAAFEANEEGEGVGTHALSLDGTDDYVDLASHVSDFPLGDSTRSITGWFKADTGNQGQTFFAYGPNVAGKRFSIAADRTQVLVAVSGHAWGVNGLEQEDGWHHVAVTYAGGDSDDILIYLDGELQSASTLVGSSKRLDTQTGPAAIGRSVSGTKHYTGLIDDVRLYDVALSAEQVLALFEEHPQTVLAEDNQEVCVSEELAADVENRIQNNNSERWTQVKNALTGKQNAITLAEVEEIYERRTQNGWSTEQWEPVLEAMECLEEGNQ